MEITILCKVAYCYFQFASSLFCICRIPDLVKDPEAEAAFEGLRGLVEASLQRDYEKQQALKKEAKLKKPTARKSTAASRLNKRKNAGTARKSTTPSSKGEYSFYKVPQDPIDFNDISTRMSVGGMKITLNVSKLARKGNFKAYCLCQ